MSHRELASITRLTADLVAVDSRSFVSNLPVAHIVEAQLAGFEIERLDWTEPGGIAKRALVARRGRGGLAFSAHMDTVPATGWTEDPFAARIDAHGVMHGLGSTDMKGPLAAIIHAARALPADVPVSLLITTDEETSKEGARRIARDSVLLRDHPPTGIIIAEPTAMRPVRGHRGSYDFIATATGIQAHSSTGLGRNANWELLPFLAEMRSLQLMLRDSPEWQDPAYEPSFCDLNLVIDNHGTAPNVTVGRATATLKFRFSRGIDADAIAERVREAAALCGVALEVQAEAKPPELPARHPLVRLCEKITGATAQTAPYGTDATELQAIAPCVILGPGDIATAHTPHERVRLLDLADSVDIFIKLAESITRDPIAPAAHPA